MTPAVITERYCLPSTDGVSQCPGIAAIPQDNIRALLLISHGMAEHTERYLPFMKVLAAHGILCFGHDHIGHGRAAEETETLGYLPRRTGADTLVSDVISDAKRFHSCYPDVPLILFGHSMGSFIARIAAAKADAKDLFDVLVLSGTGAANPLAVPGMILLTLVCFIRGEHAYSARMQNMMFGTYNDRFEKRTAFDWLSSDTSAVDRYLADPLSGFPFTVSALCVLTSLLRTSNTGPTFRNTPDDLPILLIAGRDDPVGAYGAGIHTVADAYREAGCRRVSQHLYSGARHELLNEPIAPKVIADLMTFLEDILSEPGERSFAT